MTYSLKTFYRKHPLPLQTVQLFPNERIHIKSEHTALDIDPPAALLSNILSSTLYASPRDSARPTSAMFHLIFGSPSIPGKKLFL